MSTIQDIHLFHLVDGLNSYLEINLVFLQGFQIYFNQILPFLKYEPFLSDMFLPTETVTVNSISYNEDQPILNTNLYYFISLIITELNSFKSVCISSFQSLVGEKTKTISNYSFINSFITSQERFYKNLSNFFNLFSFFQTMSYIPNFYNTNEVISSDLITLFSTGKIKRLDLTELYKFNIRNMDVNSKKILQNQTIYLYEQLKTSSIIIGNIYRKHNINIEVIQTILSQFQTFSGFFTTLFEKVVFYNQEWNNWNREVYELENIDYTQRKIEGSWNDFLSNLSSSNFITSITIDNGGDRNIVGDILTLSTNSSSVNGTAIITSTLDGVIETIGTITSGGQDFEVGDSLTLSNTTGLYADIEVATITSGFINGVSISGRGSGFTVGDSTTTSSSTGTGMTISITSVRGDLDTITLSSNGSNYQVGDILTISNTSGFTNSNLTNAELTINSIQSASVNSITISDGGDSYQLNDSIHFQNDGITIPTTVSSIIMNAIDISQIEIINKGNNDYPFSENINISIGNLSNIISASISEISNITFTTSNISITDTSTSDYQLGEVFNISYGGIIGITATISAITTTLTTQDFQVSGGTGFQLGETIDFTYGELSGQSTITSIQISVSDNNIQMNDGGSGFSINDTISFSYGNNITGTITVDSIDETTGEILTYSVSFTSNTGTISNTDTEDFTNDNGATFSFINITGSIQSISNSTSDSPGIITSSQEPTYSPSSITSNTSYSTTTTTTFEGNLYQYGITNQGSGTLSSTDLSYSMDDRTLPTNIINISGVTGDVESISINTSGTGTLTSDTISITSTNGTGLSITISDIDGEVNGLTIGSQTSGNYSGDDISIVSSNTSGSGIQVSMDVYGSIDGFSITNDGFGFMTSDTLSITGNAQINSFTIKNGQIYEVSITTGGQDYSIGDTITILKSGVTSATLDVTSIINGILKTVTINNGGQNYTEGGTITVSSGNSTSNGVIPVSTVQNGFLTGLYITNRGKGFSIGDSLTVTSSNTDTNLEVPTLSVNTIQENSLLSVTEQLNSNLSV